MNETFRKLFGMAPKVDLGQLLKDGAIIIDVRTKAEYAGGHVKGSMNIPLDQVVAHVDKLRRDKPVITCCASGMRSASAAGILRAQGFDAHNGGAWTSVRNLMRE